MFRRICAIVPATVEAAGLGGPLDQFTHRSLFLAHLEDHQSSATMANGGVDVGAMLVGADVQER